MGVALSDSPPRERHNGTLPEVTKVEFGERLKELRDRAGFNQTQLAKAAGVSQGRISEWEAGKVVPLITVADELVAALGCTYEELFGKPRKVRSKKTADD